MIVTRTVRQLLAGNGPVYNAGERAEANTSTAWTYAVALASWTGRIEAAHAAVALGLVLAVVAVPLAVDGARLLYAPPRSPVEVSHSSRGAVVLVPLGALVLLGLPPFWDFATSGLETGLVFAWISVSWWASLRCARGYRAPGLLPTAVLCGLAPVVRPELAVVGAALLLALGVAVRPPRRRALAAVLAAALVPIAYQVFRMGYYGLLVPLTAVAKEASGARWERGWVYLWDGVDPYRLWAPLALAALVLVVLLLERRPDRATVALVLAPVLSGLALLVYVVRVGGDFMHARMLLPGLLLLLLPVFAVPVPRRRVQAGLVAVAAAGTLTWAVSSALWFRPDYVLKDPAATDTSTLIADERAYWTTVIGEPDPVSPAPYTAHFAAHDAALDTARRDGLDAVLWPEVGLPPAAFYPLMLRSDLPWDRGLVLGTLGTAGAIARLDEYVVDPLGLAYPLAAHAEPLVGFSRPGHEKFLPQHWIAADLGDPDAPLLHGVSAPHAAAAREALACPAFDDLTRSVRDPLTAARFWDNLTGAVGRTSFRFPGDPMEFDGAC